MVRDEEIQTMDNVSIPFEEMKIRHRRFHDRIDRLVEVQMCHVCQESYDGIQVFKKNTSPMCI